jgi:uncharacterized protein YdeI (YjbR/CyaY-like superfamily)
VRPSNVTFFDSPAGFRRWLEKHAATAQELWVGYYKRGSGKPSITWPESVDEALCVGWIDGIRKSLDEDRYTIRFTPRRAGSNWSLVNIGRVEELEKAGRMRPAGRRAFQDRNEERARRYSYEQRTAKLAGAYEKKLRAVPKAWKYFRSQAPWYQRTMSLWVMSAKQEATRMRRLDRLIADSAQGQRIVPMKRAKK